VRYRLHLQMWRDDVATRDGEWPPLPEQQETSTTTRVAPPDADHYGIVVDALFAKAHCRALHTDVRDYYKQRLHTLVDQMCLNMKRVIQSASQPRPFAFRSGIQNGVMFSTGALNCKRTRYNYEMDHIARNARLRLVLSDAMVEHNAHIQMNVQRKLIKRERDQQRRQVRFVDRQSSSSNSDESVSDNVDAGNEKCEKGEDLGEKAPFSDNDEYDL